MEEVRKYHVNGKGRVSLCFAKDRPCPFGGDNAHFTDKLKAEEYRDKILRDEYDMIPRHRVIRRYREVETAADKNYVISRLAQLKAEVEDMAYAERCETSKHLKDYIPSKGMTKHMREERLDKENALKKEFGEGNVVGYYIVFHLNDDDPPKKQHQVTEIWDNGRISMFDYEQGHGRKVTAFTAHRARVEAIMLMAGQIPEQELLDDVTRNRNKAYEIGLS